jgi:hypothetical protein
MYIKKVKKLQLKTLWVKEFISFSFQIDMSVIESSFSNILQKQIFECYQHV